MDRTHNSQMEDKKNLQEHYQKLAESRGAELNIWLNEAMQHKPLPRSVTACKAAVVFTFDDGMNMVANFEVQPRKEEHGGQPKDETRN